MRVFIILISVLFTIMSCTVPKYIQVPVNNTKIEYVASIEYDSIYIHDSIDRYRLSDTIYITKYKKLNKFILKKDTVYKVDTITKPYEVNTIEYIEVNKLYWYQQLFVAVGILVVLAALLYLVINKLIKKIF